MSKHRLVRARYSSWRRPLVWLEVFRATENSVWIDGRRYSRFSEDMRVCDDFVTAKAWLIEQFNVEIDKLKNTIDELQKRLQEVEAITEESLVIDNNCY